jgi:TetR/AcrR family transcriptional regulator, transcriptional repressor for nem operon
MKDSRDHILATAFRLFFAKGFKEVTMAELVRESGLSKGAFYHYFESKADLFDAVLEKFLVSNMDQLSSRYDQGLSLRDNLKSLFGQSAGMVEQIRNSDDAASSGLFNYLLFLQRAMQKPGFRDRVIQFNRQYERGFALWISAAQVRGEIVRTLDPLVLARHLIGLMKGLTVMYSFIGLEESLSETFEKIIDQFFEQLKNPAYESSTQQMS